MIKRSINPESGFQWIRLLKLEMFLHHQISISEISEVSCDDENGCNDGDNSVLSSQE